MLSRFYAAIAFVLLCFGFSHNALSQTVLLTSCPLEKQSATQVVCDVRIGTKERDYLDYLEVPKTPSEVTVRWQPSGTEDVVKIEKYDPFAKKTAWLLMIDRSKSMKKDTLDRIVKDFSWVIGRPRGKEQIGIATFSEKVELVAPFDAPRADLEKILKGIQRTGDKTEINRSLITGLDYLNGVAADRKAIVVVTDGQEEGMTRPREVIEKARDLGISIYAFGYMQESTSNRDLRDLEALATETGGPYRFTDMTDPSSPNAFFFPERISDSFFSSMQSGGSIAIPRRGDKFTVTANIDGRTAESLRPVELKPTGGEGWPKSLWTKWVALFGSSLVATLVAAGLGVVAIGLLSLALVMLLRQPAESSQVVVGLQPAVAAGPTASVGSLTGGPLPLSLAGPGGFAGSGLPSTVATDKDTIIMPGKGGNDVGGIYAWLERLDSGQRIPVKATNVRIGRHDDNDIQFDLSTVHRRHAVLHMTPKREFIITDLSGDGGNGIKVNAKKTGKSSLNEGDVVEIGEVRLKFHRASA